MLFSQCLNLPFRRCQLCGVCFASQGCGTHYPSSLGEDEADQVGQRTALAYKVVDD